MRTARTRRRNGDLICTTLSFALAAALYAVPPSVVAQAASQPSALKQYNIPAGPLADALSSFGAQSGQQLVYAPDLVAKKSCSGLSGKFTPDEALTRLLKDSGVKWRRLNATTYVLDHMPDPNPAVPKAAPIAKADSPEISELPEVLVKGSRSLNADILRTENDIQPYVVFEREEIEQSLATNIEEFLNTRLPMNASRGTASRNSAGTTEGNRSSFNLRGLGTNQTLILVNGRRAPGVQGDRGTDLSQPDVNGIPIAAIESIEVLPATASGIYGGGATGGVINIILRKDYQGSEVQISYDNSFDTDSARRRIDASTGFSLESGRTQVMVSANYSDANDLLAGDRDFAARARAAALANDPSGLEFNMPPSNRTNFRSIDGNNLTLLDGTSLGTTFGSVPIGYAGEDNGAGLIDGAGAYDLSIPVGISGARQSLVTAPTTQAINFTIRREMGKGVDAYLDAGMTRNESLIRFAGASPDYLLSPGDAGNPFQNYVSFTIPAGDYEAASTSTSDTLRLNGGVVFSLPAEWTGGLDVNWNKSSNKYSQIYGSYDSIAIGNAFATGTLNPFRDTSLFPLDLSPYLSPADTSYGPANVTMTEFAARLGGPAATLPAGSIHLSGLASIRREVADSTIEPAGSSYNYFPKRHQDVKSLYVEATVPAIAPTQSVPFVNSLDVQASIRRDSYETVSFPSGLAITLPTRDPPIPDVDYQTTNFSSWDYTLGLRYRPIEDIAIRASYATGFLPPSLAQIASLVIDQGYGYVRDPKRGGERTFFPARNILGGNPNIQPESSESVSAGVVYTPSYMPGLRISLDYTQIKKNDEITTLSQQNIVDLEDEFPGRVVRAPPGPLDPAGYAGVITSLDTSVLNIAASRVEAYDLQLDYDRDLGDLGDLRLYAVATLQTALERQVLPTSPMIDRVGFSDGPLKWRGNIGFVWNIGAITVAANTQFYDRYKAYDSTLPVEYVDIVTRPQGSEYIDAQSYTDVSARYVFDNGPLDGAQISFGIRNIFDQSPPIVASYQATGGYSTYGDPRMRTYALTLKKTF